MAVRTLRYRSAMLTLMTHPTFTLSRLRAHPLGAPHVARFEALKEEGKQVVLRELDYIEAMSAAQARAVAIDIRLDEFASWISKEILTLTGDDRAHPLYTHYFDKPLNQLTRPVLRAQLAAMRRWHVSLSRSPHAALSMMAPDLAELLAEADGATEARERARQQNREFREVGERRQWVDRLNAAQKEVHGALATLPFQNPGLTSDFADLFFLSEPDREDEEDEAGSPEALRAEAASLREALARVEASLVSAEEAEAQQKAAAEAREAKKTELAELKRAAKALEQKRAAIEAEIEAMPG